MWRIAANDGILGLAENDSAPLLVIRYATDGDDYESFDPYATMDTMDKEDWNDMEDVCTIPNMNKHTHAIKYTHN